MNYVSKTATKNSNKNIEFVSNEYLQSLQMKIPRKGTFYYVSQSKKSNKQLCFIQNANLKNSNKLEK